MTRDEVINALEICTCWVPDACRDCKFNDTQKSADSDYIKCMVRLMRDALALLKAVPKRGRWIIGDNGEWACSECGYEPVVFENTPFCANCGTRMCDAKKKEGRA